MRLVGVSAALLLAACSAAPPASMTPRGPARAADRARFDALTDAARRQASAHTMLLDLTMRAPKRLAGSAGFRTAADWGAETMRACGFDNVHLEPVAVPHWERGAVESVTATPAGGSPAALRACALGGSPPTPDAGVEGEVVEITNFEQLAALGEGARGKILFFNRPMDPNDPAPFHAYGAAVNQRGRGGVEAKKAGAVAALVRSMTPRIDHHPHTGGMTPFLDDGVTPAAPSAALSTADADALHAMLARGAVRARVRLSSRFLAEAVDANVIGEWRGAELPDEWVVVGGHLDAWETGDGAHDDGAGCAHALEALRLIRAAGLRPKRSIRVVLFANEENGLRGGRAYAEKHGKEKHLFALESDRGGFAPRAFATDAAMPMFGEIADALAPLDELGCAVLQRGGGGADVSPLAALGIPLGEFIPDAAHYFDYHHAETDVVTAVDARELEQGAVAVAYFVATLADR